MATGDHDQENQMNRAIQPQGEGIQPKVTSPVCLDQNGEYSAVILGATASVLVQLLSGMKFIDHDDIHVTYQLASTLFFLCLCSGSLMVFKYEISGVKKVKYPQKMVIMVLNLLNEAAIMAENVIFLKMVDESYLPWAIFPILGLILVLILFYYKLEPDQDQGHNEDTENMVKYCFKVAKFTFSTGIFAQTAVAIDCLKNHVPPPPQNVPQVSLVIVAFLTSVVGSLSSTITTSPLQFLLSTNMCGLLELLSIIMLIFQGLVAVFVSLKFLDPVKEVLAVGIPAMVMFIVNRFQKSSTEQVANQENFSSMLGAFAAFGIVVISIFYPVQLESGECATYITYSVLFLLLAIMISLMRMAVIFCLTCPVVERAINASTMVLILVGVALLLVEFSKDVTLIGMETAVAPMAAPGPIFPPFHHSKCEKLEGTGCMLT